MAQPAHCIRSTSGLQCCLLVLLASWEAGAITFQELQKTGDSSASDHLFSPTSGLVYSTPSDHTALHSGHSPLDVSKSTETHKLKRHCNTTYHFKPIYKPTGNSPNSTSHHIIPPTSRKNPNNQGKDPNVRNGRSLNTTDSTNTHKGLSGAKDPIPTTKSKTACHKPNINKTGNQHKTVTPSGNISTTLNSKSTTSHRSISPIHNLVSPESNKIPTSSSGKSKITTKGSYEVIGTPERSKRAEDDKTAPSSRTTVDSGKTVMKITGFINRTTAATQMTGTLRELGHRTTSAHISFTRSRENSLEHGEGATLLYKNTRVPAESTKHGEETISTDENTTTTQEKTKKHGQSSTPSSRKTTRALEGSTEDVGKTTGALEGSKDHGEKTTLAHRRTTRALEGPTEDVGKTTGALEGSKDHEKKTTLANKKSTGSPEWSTEDAGKKITGALEGSKDHEAKTTVVNRKTTSAPEGSTDDMEKTTRALEGSKNYGEKTTLAHGKTTRAPEWSTEDAGKTTEALEGSKNRGEKTTLANGKTTKAPEGSTEDAGKTTGALEESKDHGAKTTVVNRKTTSAPEGSTNDAGKTTGALGESKDHGKKTTQANRKTTRAPEGSTKDAGKTTGALEGSKDHGEKTTLANERIRRTPTKSTKRDKSVTNTSSGPNKSDVTHEVPIGSFTLTTSHMELSFTTSETPGNVSHPYQNKDGSHRGLHAGGMRENDSFPAWAIVIVVLVAVILFLMFLGLIFLISYMMKTRRALTQNKEDGDPENDGGPNSYPVYLMEQQTLGMGQIASPR